MVLMAPAHFSLRHNHLVWLAVIGAVLIVIASAVSIIINNFGGNTTQLLIGNAAFDARVAKTEDQRVNGLSGTPSLGNREALLMVFPSNGDWQIWMKDMKYPIDIIWLDDQKRVVYMVQDAQPEEPASKIYAPDVDARYVVELAAGTIQKISIRSGQAAIFDVGEPS
ncbi:MAG: hypothetical protein JWN33_136 [Candidatus Saccharibacteria bacterium]|nr:hypothetical protein [Candidatus Saccharibacteria bacterium]